MTPEQFIEDVNKFIGSLEEELDGCVLVAANSLSNSIAQRIQSTGVDHNGVKYKPYSVRGLPAFFFDKHADALGGAARAFVDMKKKAHETISYAEFRKGANRQIDHRSLFLTGEMWNSFKPRKSGTLEYIYEFNNATTRQRANYNAEIIGDFARASEDEMNIAAEAFDEQLQKVVERIGL